MGDRVMIEIRVSARTAEILRDHKRAEEVGRLLDRIIRQGEKNPLFALFEDTAREAQEAGLTDEEIELELAAHKRERRF